MAEDNKHMDDAFKKMSEMMESDQYRVPYSSSFWDTAKAKLDDEQLDSAFKNAVMQASFVPEFSTNDTPSVDDMFMDAAFNEAASERTAKYDSSFFEEFLEKEGDLQMDEAFTEAASAYSVDYLPEFWNDADIALQEEGLHYEYKSDYWQEAKRLLDKSDRRVFFMKWSAAAVLLLLLSFGGSNLLMVNESQIDQNEMASLDLNKGSEVDENNTSSQNLINEFENSTEDVTSESSNLAEEENTTEAIDFNESINSSSQTESHIVSNEDTDQTSESTDHALTNYTSLNNRNEDNNEVTDKTNLNANNSSTENLFDLPEIYEEKVNISNTTAAERIGYQEINKFQSPAAKNIPLNKMPDIEFIKPKPTTAHELAVLVEVGLGTKYGQFDYLPTLRSSAGIEYTVASGKRLRNWQFGGSFMIHHIKQSKLGYEERSTVYDINGLNNTSYWTKLQYEHLLFGNLNLSAKYVIAPKHKIGFNIGAEKLLGVRSNMSYMNNKQNEISTINDNWGIKDGINQFDIRLGLNYEVKFNNKLSMRFNSHFGLLDRTDDKFFDNEQKDHEIGITVGLKYNFMRRMK